tara:strand:- start:5188 stop:7401 length:2214 start_codon:yes stop_codon:yes gene_type:complete
MARISTYDRDLVLSRDDILIGSDANNTNVTRNYSVGSLIDFISLSAGGTVDTNYYLSGITVNSSTNVVTFQMNGIDNQELTLGSAAFSAASSFMPATTTFNTSQVVGENEITAYYLNVSGNGTSGQLLASDGDGSFSWVSSASISDTNFYLDGITKDGNVLTFSVNGASNPSFTFGSAAFESVSSIKTQLASGLAITDLDTSALKALAYKDTVDTNEITDEAITTLKVAPDAITEEKLKISNAPVSGYSLTSDGADGFTWVANSAANYFLNSITQNNETLTFNLGGGFSGTDPTFTFGSAAFKDVETAVTGRNAAKIPRADHTHTMSHVTDAGSLATLNAIGTSNISNNAVTAAKLSPSAGTTGQVLALDSSGNLTWSTAGSGASTFIAMTDTPNSFGSAGQMLAINTAANALQFQDFKVSNANHFTTVNTGTAGKVLALDANNQSGTNYKGLKWVDTSQVGATTFTALTDTPSSIGSAHQLLTVNSAGNALEFRALDANHLVNDIITTAMIADDAITTPLIADDAITNALIADNAVGTAQIAASAVTETKLGTSAVTTNKINNLAVTEAKIAANAVAFSKLKNDVILSALPNAANTRTQWDTTGNTKIDFYVNGNNEMRLEADGDLQVDGDVIAFSTAIASDERIKENIEQINNPIEKIKKIKGVTFDWRKTGKASGGIIAQDVQQVMPSIVKEVNDLELGTSHLTVDYNGVIGLLVETVKQQQKDIEILKSKIDK